MINFKIIENLPILDLHLELNSLLKDNQIEWSKDNQICLNTVPGHEEDFHFGSGSLQYDWKNNTVVIDEYGNEKIIVNPLAEPKKEEQFTVLCNQFKNTAFEIVYNALSTTFEIGRIRLMKSKPKTCLSWHIDTSPRIHFPVKTQDGCYMVIDNEVCHLKSNMWWWTNTVLPHTAFNGSKEDRIHLVASILG